MKWLFVFFITTLCLPHGALAGPNSIAGEAAITSSSVMGPGFEASNIADGIIGVENRGEWAAAARNRNYPWVRLTWEEKQWIDCIVLYDRPSQSENLEGCRLEFSDGSKIWVTRIPKDGTAKKVEFPEKNVEWVQITGIDGDGVNLGLSEVEVFPSPKQHVDYVDWVDPYIETNRGRYFYFITGQLPYGMMSAAPLTRNKNHDGGGYNYNESHILCFSQIHWWSMSGIGIMPARDEVDPTQGESAWKSAFSHDDEIVQPGYHRVLLRDPGVWVEQTATERVSFYRFRWTESGMAQILTNLGGFLGNSVMANADVRKTGDAGFEGSFSSVKRPWGGPADIKVFFVVRFDKPFASLDGWSDGKRLSGIESLRGTDAGVSARYDVRGGEQVQMKIGISLTSVENAKANLEAECPGWDFDTVRAQSRGVWNEWMSRIDVRGGTEAQRTKFYTDLWHVLLGRHKMNDLSGDYPDRTQGKRTGRITDAVFKIRTIPRGTDGRLQFNMYNFDATWGQQWNLDILWGLAYPEVADDFAASLIEYADNGYLLPRGPVGGGYSYIMRGNPSVHPIVSCYMMGILTKRPDAAHAYDIIRRNSLKGGMLEMPPQVTPEDIEFYDRNGWVPSNAGITLDAAFQDWAIAQMARKLGNSEDYDRFMERSRGWRKTFDSKTGFVFPMTRDGKFLHSDPLSGEGWVETNAWQATFSVVNDYQGLASLMGGRDSVAAKLDRAFRMAAPADFVSEYHTGYVAYSNQPCLSNAHVFSHMGQPWLTQYWVRRVKEQAYGGTTPDLGYGGHDEDQGQMGGTSALMAMGLFNVYGNKTATPFYEITSPVFDEVTIRLDNNYYKGKTFAIKTYNNSADNCYIQRARLNGRELREFWFTHDEYRRGGTLEIWLGDKPNKKWGTGKMPAID